MTKFERLFGTNERDVKPNCILMPMPLNAVLNEFNIKVLSKGKLYRSASTDDLTVIITGIGPAFAGDAVLHLKDTPCRNILLFGSCGLVKEKEGLTIGGLVAAVKCFSNESFSHMLAGHRKDLVSYPDRKLLNEFQDLNKCVDIAKVTCSTISSLKLEEDMIDYFAAEGVEIVDMECSAVFSAASKSGLKSMAIFYISDIIKKYPFYMDMDDEHKIRLVSCIKRGAGLINEFIKNRGCE